MRNKFPGPCYRCGQTVEPGRGHFERHRGHWRVQHAGCTLLARAIGDLSRRGLQSEAHEILRLIMDGQCQDRRPALAAIKRIGGKECMRNCRK